jgi:hypothetical protein
MSKTKLDAQTPRLDHRGADDIPGYVDGNGRFHGVNHVGSLAATAVAHEHRTGSPLTLATRDRETGVVNIQGDADDGGL